MNPRHLLASLLCAPALLAASAHAAITFVAISNDADSGISTANTYTHTLDFGQGTPGALINGVQFNAYNLAASGTLNFSRTATTGTLADHVGNVPSGISGALTDLMRDMYFNNTNTPGGTTTWTIAGLTAGVTYDTRIYTRQWSASTNQRVSSFVFDPDGAGPLSETTGAINQDDATTVGFAAENQPYYINYRFTAVEGQNLTITLTQANNNNSWHLYGLTNQVVPAVPEPMSAVLLGMGALGLLARRRP